MFSKSDPYLLRSPKRKPKIESLVPTFGHLCHLFAGVTLMALTTCKVQPFEDPYPPRQESSSSWQSSRQYWDHVGYLQKFLAICTKTVVNWQRNRMKQDQVRLEKSTHQFRSTWASRRSDVLQMVKLQRLHSKAIPWSKFQAGKPAVRTWCASYYSLQHKFRARSTFLGDSTCWFRLRSYHIGCNIFEEAHAFDSSTPMKPQGLGSRHSPSHGWSGSQGPIKRGQNCWICMHVYIYTYIYMYTYYM